MRPRVMSQCGDLLKRASSCGYKSCPLALLEGGRDEKRKENNRVNEDATFS